MIGKMKQELNNIEQKTSNDNDLQDSEILDIDDTNENFNKEAVKINKKSCKKHEQQKYRNWRVGRLQEWGTIYTDQSYRQEEDCINREITRSHLWHFRGNWIIQHIDLHKWITSKWDSWNEWTRQTEQIPWPW